MNLRLKAVPKRRDGLIYDSNINFNIFYFNNFFYFNERNLINKIWSLSDKKKNRMGHCEKLRKTARNCERL